MPADGGIGASTKRREDVRFLTGTGRYTDDLNRPGQAYVYFLRSMVAHGTLNNVNTSDAAAMPGVIRIFTGKDFEGVGGLPCGWQVTDKHGDYGIAGVLLFSVDGTTLTIHNFIMSCRVLLSL